jgi:hypothetical protein
MTRKRLPGIIAVITGPQDTAAACEAARERVIRAAIAYVGAWRDWQTREEYAPKARQRLYTSMDELVRAVEGLGEKV